MKKNILIIISIITFAPLSFTTLKFNVLNFNKRNTGTIGDVKYSILNPEQFVMVNGDGWVLLDGKKIDFESGLYKLLHTTGHSNVIPEGKLPNGDGVFIRGIDTNENDHYGDTDKGRIVGSFQEDAIRNITGSFLGSNPNQQSYVTGSFSSQSFDQGDHNSWARANNRGTKINFDASKSKGIKVANENRPKNINLYIYIKINEPN